MRFGLCDIDIEFFYYIGFVDVRIDSFVCMQKCEHVLRLQATVKCHECECCSTLRIFILVDFEHMCAILYIECLLFESLCHKLFLFISILILTMFISNSVHYYFLVYKNRRISISVIQVLSKKYQRNGFMMEKRRLHLIY